jgi:hypothetical protein
MISETVLNQLSVYFGQNSQFINLISILKFSLWVGCCQEPFGHARRPRCSSMSVSAFSLISHCIFYIFYTLKNILKIFIQWAAKVLRATEKYDFSNLNISGYRQDITVLLTVLDLSCFIVFGIKRKLNYLENSFCSIHSNLEHFPEVNFLTENVLPLAIRSLRRFLLKIMNRLCV